MSQFDHDVLIIGGGPSGSTAAAYARQQGFNVCLVERLPFPRFHIGESLLPHGNEIMRETGAWPKVERAGFIKKSGAIFHLANGLATKEIVFSEGIVRGLDQTFQVGRGKFDALLLDHARDVGTEIKQPATVRAVTPVEGGLRVTIEHADKSTEERTARWVLDAGGRENHFPFEAKKPLDPSPFPKRVAIYSHFENVFRPSGMAAGHTVIVRLADGWFWLIPIDEAHTSVGLVTTVESMRRGKGTPEEIFNHAVASSPKLRELMQGARASMEFHVTSDYSYFRQELATDRMVMIGDAGGFFDPIFSSGVYVGMNSARDAVRLITNAQRENRGLTQAERTSYSKRIKKRAKVFKDLITCFYDNDAFSVFLCATPPLGLDRAVNSIVAGDSRMLWPVKWRFKLFLLICRLQKRFAVVPRIDFSGMHGVEASSTLAPASLATGPGHGN
ncbi:MAG: NAD(P)/FAD-dependent oxidoreductase [Nibricoccus sp.]